MLDRLATTAAGICRAHERRASDPSAPHDRMDALCAVLRQDYHGHWPSEPPGDAPPTPDQVTRIAEIFGLDDLASTLLAIAAAPEFDANLGRAFRHFTGRSVDDAPTVALALELAGIPTLSTTAITCIDASAPVVRHQLLTIDGSGPRLGRVLRVPDRVVAYLADAELTDPLLIPMRTAAVPLPSAEARTIAGAIGKGHRLLWIRNPPGGTGLSLAAAAFSELGRQALVLDARLAPADRPLAASLAVATREAALTDRVLAVTGGEALRSRDQTSPSAGPAAARVLADAPIPVIVVGAGNWNTGWLPEPVIQFDADSLHARQRRTLWRQHLPGADEIVDAAAATLRLTPEGIVTAATYARALAAVTERPISAELVAESARVAASADTAGAAPVPRTAGTRLDDVILPEPASREIRRLRSWVLHRDEVSALGQVDGHGGARGGIAALFAGNPGTGKTLAAHALADDLNLELLQVDLSATIDKYIGETEKNLERIFQDAERRNVVLFFDEADALFGARSGIRDAHDRYANQEIAYLLQRMEHFDGLTILATNLRGNLDTAFSRRLHFVIHFPDPDASTRADLWRAHLRRAGAADPDDPIDVDLLAGAVEMSGGDIRNIVLAATYDAVDAGRPIGMRHVRQATVRELAKLGRRPPAGLSQ